MKKKIAPLLVCLAKLSIYIFPPALAKRLVYYHSLFIGMRVFILCGGSKMYKYICIRSPHLISGFKYIDIGDDFYSGYNLRMECIDLYYGQSFTPKLKIGNNVTFNNHCHIGVINSVTIGNNVLLGSNVLIIDHSHGNTSYSDIEIAPTHRILYSKGPIVIEDNVWIGENVCILPNVCIGRNCVIGANTVVTKSIPSYCVVAGNPMKIVKELNTMQSD